MFYNLLVIESLGVYLQYWCTVKFTFIKLCQKNNYNLLQDFTKSSSQVESDESSDQFCLSHNTIPLSQDGSTIDIGLVLALFLSIVKKILDEYTYAVNFYF